MKALYKYPQREFPYARWSRRTGARQGVIRSSSCPRPGVSTGRYFDVTVEYAKAGPDDVLIRLTIANRGPEAATLHVLPTLWFRNTWSWGRTGEGYWPKPRITGTADGAMAAEHVALGRFTLVTDGRPPMLFTDNETNVARLFGVPNGSPYVKDAFHEYVVHGRSEAVNPANAGTKAAFLHVLDVPARDEVVVRLRLGGGGDAGAAPAGRAVDQIFTDRRREADDFYDARIPAALDASTRSIVRQGYASLLWSKKFYHYVVRDWLEGDPAQPPPPGEPVAGSQPRLAASLQPRRRLDPGGLGIPLVRRVGSGVPHAAVRRIDPIFAKEQLVLFTREWYMHPSGQLPAYEFALGDVNPAGARLGRVARLQDDRDRAASATASSCRASSRRWRSTSPGG
jgi:hypothetical protein